MKIAICDDENVFVSQIMLILLGNSDVKLSSNDIHIFHSGTELIQLFSPSAYNIIFLDISMPGMDGIETGKRISELDSDVHIIFVTALEEYLPQGYEVFASGFIVKPFTEKEIYAHLRRIISQNEKSKKHAIKLVNDSTIFLAITEIIYISSQGHYLTVHARGAPYEYIKRMDDEQRTLAESGFIRIHRSFLVNMAYIWGIDAKIVTLKGNIELPIGRKFVKITLESYSAYRK